MRKLLAGLLLACVAAPAPAANFLWEVVSMTNRAYLYGTVHAGKQGWYPLPKEVEEALADSKVLVVEADITDRDAMARTGAAMVYEFPDTLKNHVPEKDYERFRKILPRYGLAEDQVARMKPLMAVSLIVFAEWQRQGYFPQYGVDAYLIAKAKAEVKPIVEIEGMQAQVDLMRSLTDAENDAIFEGTLTALEGGLTGEQITGVIAAWQAGDPQRVLEVAEKYNKGVPGAAEFEEKFIWSRHDAMLKKFDGYLNESRDRHFVAVGSLHLAGPKGLVEQLRKRGYIVRQK